MVNTILTDDEIEDAWCKYGDEMGGADQSDALRIGREIEAAVLAKLREQEPVAMRYDFDGYGYRYIDSGSGSDWRTRIPDAEAVYAAPLPAVVQVQQEALWGLFNEHNTPMKTRDAVLALLAAPQPAVAQVPQGWKLVPVEPTPEMLAAVVTSMDEALHGPNAEKQYVEDWKAMLAAAPQQPAPQPLHGWKLVPVGLLEKASASIGSFVSDHGWSQEDMDTMDSIDAILAAPEAPAQGECKHGGKTYEASTECGTTVGFCSDCHQTVLIDGRPTQPPPEAPAQAAPSADEVERGDVVAFEFYNRATGHAIVDYSVNTHVGNLSADKGYEARPLVYADKREEVTDGSKPIPLWQAREALDELEAAARGDEPFNHFAAGLVRSALEQAAAPEAPATAVVQVPPIPLNIIRKWPDGFEARLQHVWKDVISFIPSVKLWDLQRVLAEFGFRMEVYDQTSAPKGRTE